MADLIRLRNQSGTWLLLLPSLWSLVLANQGRPPMWLLGVFTLGAFVMRSLGVVFNDLADRNFDPHVERTKERPLASGKVSPREALILFFVMLTLAGVLGFQQMKIQQFPDIDLPTINVTASLPGTAPAQMETEVARKIENAVASLQGVKNIYTKVQDGVAIVTVQ